MSHGRSMPACAAVPERLGVVRAVVGLLWVTLVVTMRGATGVQQAAEPPAPPQGALGYPSRSEGLDVLPGFRDPPPGYGEVPFWWWTGDPLDRDRLRWQIEELHRKGVAGVQVNYAHDDTPGWPTYPAEPGVFTDAWWDMWHFVAEECGKRDMGIGLSGYTLDWPNGRSLVSRTIYADPEITGCEIRVVERVRVAGGMVGEFGVPADAMAVRAHPLIDGLAGAGSVEVPVGAGAEPRRGRWRAPEGRDWELWVYATSLKPGSLNPMHPLAGRRVVEKFFQPFEDHAPGRSSRGLNYFFHDELQFGVGEHAWTSDLPARFRERKGYDVFDALPAMFSGVGARTSKARLDFLDVRMQLIQERYFIPIFEWHWSRGLIFGCDQGSRGLDPGEFGDYVGAVRWYTAPGHDTPGGRADLIKGKVSSSIAQLYRRPRVWLEGYHSLGWAAAPERLMEATCENYLYGCNLLNLHGLYYTTHGGFWEWAPPCYHFRMPYWEHMGTFLKYFERLSYVLSQGSHQCDIAILYPVSPVQAGLGGREAVDLAFAAGRSLFGQGRDFVFLDDESLARSEVEDGRLRVSEAAYKVLVLPGLRAVRWATLEKALAFREAGGWVVALGALPEASDRAGAGDPVLDAAVRDLFRPADPASGGRGTAVGQGGEGLSGLEEVLAGLPKTVQGGASIRALHRRVGPREVFWVMGAARGEQVVFRAPGRAEWWDPWAGEVHALPDATPVAGGTRVRMPRGAPEGQLIVFSPESGGSSRARVISTDLEEVGSVEDRGGAFRVVGYASGPGRRTAVVEAGGRRFELSGEASGSTTLSLDGPWEFELQPTLDNRWGDFRLPVEERWIGAEARRFRYHEWTEAGGAAATPPLPYDAAGEAAEALTLTHGYGVKFWRLGPLPPGVDTQALEEQWARRRRLDPGEEVPCGGTVHRWQSYAFSWRWGKEGDPGHQGFHGLKGNVSDDFLCLGRPVDGHNETVYREESGGTRYLLWTSVYAGKATRARLRRGGLIPTAIYLNGARVDDPEAPIPLQAGANPLLLRYDAPGRGHFVVQEWEPGPEHGRTPLSMRWYDAPGVLPFEAHGDLGGLVGGFQFLAPPGLRRMQFRARGDLEVFVAGRQRSLVAAVENGMQPSPRGYRAVEVRLPEPIPEAAEVVIRIRMIPGATGGDAIPEPVLLECGQGLAETGDWSRRGALETYSGGAWYRRSVVMESDALKGRVRLQLGRVVATAEVRVNGERVGIRVAPPWAVDLEKHLRPGTNRLEVLVFNTLANHYRTIPTRYGGPLTSGLLGPVRLEFSPEIVLE